MRAILVAGVLWLVAASVSTSQQTSSFGNKGKPASDSSGLYWRGGLLLTPYGTCGIVVRLGEHFGIRRGHIDDERTVLFDNVSDARSAVWDYCVDWFHDQKVAREAVNSMYHKLSQAQLKKLYLDLREPVFTKANAMSCPTWEAAYYASTARDHGWKFPGGLAGIDVPPPSNGDALIVGGRVSPSTWSCSIQPADIPVTLTGEKSPSGTAVRTNIGWVISLDSLHN